MTTSPTDNIRINFGGSFREVLPSLLFMASIFFLTFVARIIGAPLLPVIEEEIGINHGQGGSLFLCIAVGYLITIIISPSVSSHIGNKKTIVLSGVLTGLSVIFLSFCRHLLNFQLVSFTIGLSAGLYLPAAMVTISELTPPSYLTRGMSIHELAPNLGFVLSPLIASLICWLFDWRHGLQGFGVFTIVWSLLFLRYGYDAVHLQPPLNVKIASYFFKQPLFWRMTIMFSFAAGSTMAVYSMLPLMLVNIHGMSVERANSLVAISRIGSVVMPLLGGWLGDRFGNGRVMMGVLLIAGLTTVPMGFFSGGTLLFFIFLQPLIAVAFFPSCFARFARFGEGNLRGLGISLGTPIGFLMGGGMIPLLIGTVGDVFGLDVGFIVAGLLTVVVALFAGWNRSLLSREEK